MQATVSEATPMLYALPSPQGGKEASSNEQQANLPQQDTQESDEEQGANNYERVEAYLAGHPDAKVRDVAEALRMSTSAANKWIMCGYHN